MPDWPAVLSGMSVRVADYGAIPDDYYIDGVANATTTFTSATANFTSDDVGKYITIEKAGAGAFITLHTTISSVTNSTTVVLANAAGRSQSNCRFYISRAGDQLAAIQAAVDDAAALGLGGVLLEGRGYLLSGSIVGKNHVVIESPSRRGCLLHLTFPNVRVPVWRNDYTSQNGAQFCGIRSCTLDGAQDRNTTDYSTTTSGTYSKGATMTLTTGGAAGLLPSGTFRLDLIAKTLTNIVAGTAAGTGNLMRVTSTAHGFTSEDTVQITGVVGTTQANNIWKITVIDANTYELVGSNMGTATAYTSGGSATKFTCGYYTSVSGDVISGVVLGREDSTPDVNWTSVATGANIVFQCGHGVYTTTQPYANIPTNSDIHDPFYVIEDLYIREVRGQGVSSWSQQGTNYQDIFVLYAQHCGFTYGFDTMVTNCTSEGAGKMGFLSRSGIGFTTACKSYTSGGSIPGFGHGFLCEGPVSLEDGNQTFETCSAQDNNGHGFLIKTAQRVRISGSSSCNGCAGQFAGFQVGGWWTGIELDGATNTSIDVTINENGHNGGISYQTNALGIRSTTAILTDANDVRIQWDGAAGGTVGAAIRPGSDLSGNNAITILSTRANGATGDTGFWTPLRKTANTAKINTAALANDPDLAFPMISGKTYAVRGVIFYDTTAAGDMKYTFVGGTPTLFRGEITATVAGAIPAETAIATALPSSSGVALAGTGTTGGQIVIDAIITAAANVTFAFQHAQNTATADTGAIALAGSYLEYMRC